MLPTALSLDGTWTLAHGPVGAADPARFPADGRLEATVPGDVLLDLMRHGVIADPVIDDGAERCAWVGEREWWFERVFAADVPIGARHELVCDGLIYVADLWLNGVHLGRHLNMHRPFRAEVGPLLRPDGNRLVVRLLPFDPEALKTPVVRSNAHWSLGIANKEYCIKRGATHKAIYTFGTDWSQGLPVCGIWRGVRIESTPLARIDGLQVIATPDGAVRTAFTCETLLSDTREAVCTLSIRERDSGTEVAREVQKLILGPGRHRYDASTRIGSPRLWWPAGLGAQHLYVATVALSVDGTAAAEARSTFGVRSFAIDEPLVAPDQGAFRFVVNGEPVFAKGANWIPPDIIPARADDARYETLLAQYVEAGCNYLRFWGGGVYERERFYELCDEKGLLVLHDMMFCCFEVPDFDPAFVAEAVAEVEYNVTRLRNHPCIVVWSGANEADCLPIWGLPPRPDGTYYGHHLLHEVLPAVIARLDPTRPYIPSDPCLGRHNPHGRVNDVKHGTHHGNFATHAFSSDDEIDARGVPSFVDECYAASPCEADSHRRFLTVGELDWRDPRFLAHDIVSVALHGRERSVFSAHLWHHAAERFAAIPSAEKAAAFTANHRLLVKRYTEALRLRRDRCGGLAFWMFDSAFTMNDWSYTDYYCLPKAVFYEAKRCNRMLMPVIAVRERGLAVHVLNDHLDPRPGLLRCEIRRFDGTQVWAQETHLIAPANAVSAPLEAARDALPAFDPAACYAAAVFTPDGGAPEWNHRLLASPRALRLPEAVVSLAPVAGRAGAFTLTARGFARNVRLTPHRPDLRCDDNFFDLLPGEVRTVAFNRPVAPAEVGVAWDNQPGRQVLVTGIAKPDEAAGSIPPIVWTLALFNPSGTAQRLPLAVQAPEGVRVAHPAEVALAPGAAAEVELRFDADPALVPAMRDLEVDLAVGAVRIHEILRIASHFRLVADGLETGAASGSERWTLVRQTLGGGEGEVPLGPAQPAADGRVRRTLDLPSDTLPHSCSIRGPAGTIGDFCGGPMDAGRLWAALPAQPFATTGLRAFPCAGARPLLHREGHGYRIDAAGTDPGVAWTCGRDASLLLFLHHGGGRLFLDLLVRGLAFDQPHSGLDAWQGSCLEVVLGTADGASFTDFSLALTPAGAQRFHRRGVGSGLAADRGLRIHHRPDDLLTSYHLAFPATELPGLLAGGAFRLGLVVCESKPRGRTVTIANGVAIGIGAANAARVSLV